MHQYTFEARLDVDRNGGGARCGDSSSAPPLYLPCPGSPPCATCTSSAATRGRGCRTSSGSGTAAAWRAAGAWSTGTASPWTTGRSSCKQCVRSVPKCAKSVQNKCQSISARAMERQVAAADHRMLCAESPLPEHGPPPRARRPGRRHGTSAQCAVSTAKFHSCPV